MGFLAVARRKPLNQICQLLRRLKFSQRAVVNNRLRKPARIALIAVFPKNFRQRFGFFAVHQIRRRHRLPVVHPHIERTVLHKTEAAFGDIQLRRTHAQIQQHAVTTLFRNPVRQFRKISAPDFKPSGKFFS